MKYRMLKFLAMILAFSALAAAQDLASFEKRITRQEAGQRLNSHHL